MPHLRFQRISFSRVLSAFFLWALPAFALAVVNVNITIVDAKGNALNVTELVFHPGTENQLRARNRGRDNKVTGIQFNEGDRVPVEATGPDGKKYKGTLIVPRANGKPEAPAHLTLFPKTPVSRSQSQSSSSTSSSSSSASAQTRHTRKKKARRKKARKKSIRQSDFALTRQSSPLIDDRGVGTTTTVSQVELEKIPSARDPWAVLQTIPGVQVDRVNVGGNESGQQSSYTGPGNDSSNASWAVDGVIITDFTAFGTSPSYYNFSAFEEAQIPINKDIPYISGVTINLVTKRGTNEWRGSGRFISTDNAWTQDINEWTAGRDEQPNTPSTTSSAPSLDFTQDNDLNLGGYLVKDKIWVWANYGQNEIDLLTIKDVSDFTKLEDYTAKLNTQLTQANEAGFFYHYGDKVKTGRNVSVTRPQATTWDQAGPTDIYKLEDSHVFNSSFFLTSLQTFADGSLQLDPGISVIDPGTPDSSREFNYRLSMDGIYSFNIISNDFSSPREFREGIREWTTFQPNTNGFKSTTGATPNSWKSSQPSNAKDEHWDAVAQSWTLFGGSCYPIQENSQGNYICGGGAPRQGEAPANPKPPLQLMVQSPTDFFYEHFPASFGEGQGPKLAKGHGVKMPNYAWVFPGNWQTDVVMGPDQRQVAVTAPTWLSADRVIMVDDGVGAKSFGKDNLGAFAEQLWQLTIADPQPCKVALGGQDRPSRSWMLLQTKSGAGEQHFAIQLGARPGWVELNDKGQAKLFGYTLRYNPVTRLLWLVAGTTNLNREPAYSIDVSKLSYAWASLKESIKPFDAKSNALRLCGTGKAVQAPVTKPTKQSRPAKQKKPTGKGSKPLPPFNAAKLSACDNIKKKVPAKVLTLALQSPATVLGAGYACHVGAPPLPDNPVRARLTLRSTGNSYHPLRNPLMASCTCAG